MMKNSKLSKLVVAGVSVAMLASALAPMAFADEESTTTAGGDTVAVYVYAATDISAATPDSLTEVQTVKAKQGSTYAWTDGGNRLVNNAIAVGTAVDKVVTNNTIFDLTEFSVDDYKWTGDWAMYSYGDTGTKSPAAWTTNPVKTGSGNTITLADLYNNLSTNKSGSTITKRDTGIAVVLKVKAIPAATVSYTAPSVGAGNLVSKVVTPFVIDYADSAKADMEESENVAGAKVVYEDSIVLPNYAINDGYVANGMTITVKKGGNNYTTLTGYKMGQKVAISSLIDKTNFDLGTITFDVAHNIGQIKAVEATLPDVGSRDAKIEYTDKNGKKQYKDLSTVNKATIAQASNDDLKKIVDWNADKTVYFGETRVLPNYVVMTKDEDGNDVVDTDWTFDRWVISCSNGDLLANGKPANGYALEGTTFDPTEFKATKDATKTQLTLVPVFTKDPESADVITYSAAKTPNDKVIRYVNGDPDSDLVVWGVANKFEGGLFYNEVDEVFEYYLPLNTKGKWEIDTTVDGLKDGVFFADGKQDTEAYGLKKVSGAAEDDKFFYLVSDGLYVDDYTGIWVDEDGSIYNLINGCTSDVPFTGIVEKDGWATSVKDSKVDDKANGFILYGETQYWFINGTCNLNETEAVREHTAGNFYYTVGAKIDFTFNGECNGHTFVNGVASK